MRLRVAIVAAVLAACGVEHRAREPEVTTTAARIETVPLSTGSAMPLEPAIPEAPVGVPAAAPMPVRVETPAAGLRDSQIAAITDEANEATVLEARLALARASDVQVKEFAQLVYDHRRDAKLQQRMLMSSRNLSAEPTAASAHIAEEGDRALLSLSSLSLRISFDRAYVQQQVMEHRRLLDALDYELIPAARDVELRKLLIEWRPRVSEDLDRALMLRGILSH